MSFYGSPYAGFSDHNCCNHHRNEHKSEHKSKPKERDCLQDFVGKNVKINKGGPDSLEGKVLAVKSDYLVLCTKEGIKYVQLSHIKSITENREDCKSSGGCRHRRFINANNFKGVLRALDQNFVKVSAGGPDKVDGFLAEVCKDSIKVVDGRKITQILNDQIRWIAKEDSCGNRSNGNKNDNKNDNKSGNKNENKNENKNKNKSGNNNRSGGNNRTGGNNRSGGNRKGNRSGGR
ncbi:DUF6897 domain-containing protein [Paenibacillus sp. NPDC058071]|uniref:DUF6897 domain-containing protein n=1 Tax=Paenibacillus sp. NPDC058071 TaxID=3346326 RepID=UPI0036D7F126